MPSLSQEILSTGQIKATLICKHPTNSRTWEVRIEGVTNTIYIASIALQRARIIQPVVSNAQNLAISDNSAQQMVIDEKQLQMDENEDSSDSLDDGLSDINEPEGEEDLLCPHGQQWQLVLPSTQITDTRTQIPTTMNLLWQNINLTQFGSSAVQLQQQSQDFGSRKPIHYFMLSFPINLVHSTINRTNNDIEQSSHPSWKMDTGIFFKFIGLLYGMTLSPVQNQRNYWREKSNSFLPAPNFGRFMTLAHFEHFKQHISWSQSNPQDNWSKVRDWFTEYNKRRISTVIPSDRLTIDELMSMNRTNRTKGNNVQDGLPHQTKIARKPEGVGSEIRCLIDGKTLVMLQLELQESKEEMAKKRFLEEVNYLAGTAGTLRLAEPWFNSGRTIYGDSAFASVNTAFHLRRYGLHFMGLVKTAHREFPKRYFKEQKIEMRSGATVHAWTKKGDFHLFAACWWDKTQKQFISTCGTNEPAPPHKRVRYILENGINHRIFKETQTTAIPHEYFSFAQKVDVHNHRRQGILAMERTIQTQKWEFRLICTLLGIIMVDAYMMFCHENDSDEQTSFESFVNEVAMELANNSLGLQRARINIQNTQEESKTRCELVSINSILSASNRKRKKIHLKCSVCPNQTETCCQACSTPSRIVAICSHRAKRNVPCYNIHLENPTNVQ